MKILLLTFAAALALSGSAYAVSTPGDASAIPSGFFFKPYVGADYQYTSVNYKDNGDQVLADSFNGGDVHIGARVHQYLGFEGGYSDTASSNKSNILGTGLNSSVKLEEWTLDAMGYLPIDQAHKFELIATAGIARVNAHGSLTIGAARESGNGWENDGRIGAGAQYWLTDNINVRGLVRYQGADFGGLASDAIISSLGVNYQF